MAEEPETHRLQPDPPEGDPTVIDRELARLGEKDAASPSKEGGTDGKTPDSA